jgi:hypothetical protein
MSNEEYKQFLNLLEKQYPAFAEWLKRPGHDWRTMSQTYYEGLKDESVTIDEAKDVLKGWTNGTIEGAPVGFENQRFLANLLNAVRDDRNRKLAQDSRKNWSRDILGDCQDLPIRSKIPNNGPFVGRMVAEFQRLVDAKRAKGVATV